MAHFGCMNIFKNVICRVVFILRDDDQTKIMTIIMCNKKMERRRIIQDNLVSVRNARKHTVRML